VASVAPPVDETINSKYRYQGWMPCVEWCKEHFGPQHELQWHFVGEGVFEFRHEQDLVAFLLRWG
jgi:hypothetical protein